jgi:hypothetical protein
MISLCWKNVAVKRLAIPLRNRQMLGPVTDPVASYPEVSSCFTQAP